MVNLLIALAVALAGFFGGWTSNGWRMGEQVQALKAQHEKTVADAEQASNQRLIALTNDRDAKADRLSAIDAQYTAQLSKARHENQALFDRINAGAVGLRIAATCPAKPAGSTEAAQGGGVDSAAGAVLDSVASRTYTALRANIVVTENTLSACQKSLAEFSN